MFCYYKGTSNGAMVWATPGSENGTKSGVAGGTAGYQKTTPDSVSEIEPLKIKDTITP